MGTRSTVKFYEEGKMMLGVYQQYDGYIEGVGAQIAELLEKYTIVNGVGGEGTANGFGELALFYITNYKTDNGNLYATTEDDIQEYNYVLTGRWADSSIKVSVTDCEGHSLFSGDSSEFVEWVKEYSK